jgi:hypothetical protein
VTSVAVRPAHEQAERRAWSDRLAAALPLLLVFVWLLLVYAWQAWRVPSPWLFSDELEYTQLARSLAETGETARRGAPHPYGSLYVVATAPAWLIGDTQTAYEAAKYIGVLLMTAVLFPVYGLARLLVAPPYALFAAAGAAAIPAFMYSGLLLVEPLAYPYAALSFLLFVRALAGPTIRSVAGAALVAAVGPLVRPQFGVLAVVLALAAALALVGSPRGRAAFARLSRWDRVGVATLALGGLVLANELATHRSVPWEHATRHWKDRILDYALDAGGALAIGIGVLPAIAGIAALGLAVRERDDLRLRAFGAVAAAALVSFGFYAGVKAAYLSTIWESRIPERNIIYVAPLLFVGTAVLLERRRLPIAWAAAATAFVGAVLLTTKLELSYPYFEAPGFSILTLANRHLEWDAAMLRTGLVVVLAVSVLLLVLARLAAGRRRLAGAVAATAAVLVLAWNLTGQLGASDGSHVQAEFLLSGYTTPVDWVDRATGGADALYLGQQIQDANQIHLVEFWNRSIKGMWSLDGTARGPGPTRTPDVAEDGALVPDPGFGYVVAEPGIELVGEVVAEDRGLRVFRIEPPLRLREASTGVYEDGWSGPSSTYTRYDTPGGRPGTIHVNVSRLGWAGTNIPSEVRIRVGPLVVAEGGVPQIGRVTAEETWVVHNQTEKTFPIPTPAPPFQVDVAIDPPFVPADEDPSSTDRRIVGAQLSYRFLPG